MRRLAVAAGAAVVTLAANAPARTVSDDALRIGVLTDMTGPYADPTGPGSVVAAQIAVDEFGGRMFGKPIVVLSADHQNKPDVGAAKARAWFDVEGVDMVTDVPNSAVALAVAKLAADKKRVFLAVGAATTRLTNEDCNPFTVHWMYDTYSLASGTAKAIARAGGDTWFFLTADYAFGHSLEKDAGDVLKAMGAKVLGQARHPLNASDFSSFMVQAQASKAKIVGLANAGSDAINAVKSASEFGLTPKQSLAGLLLNITDVHSLGLEKARGMLVTEGFYWDLDERSRGFARRYFERTRRMPSAVQAGVYSATLNYLRAVESAGTDEPGAVMEALRRRAIDDPVVRNGAIRRDGRLMKPMYLLEVKAPSQSKGPWDYYRLVATLPAEDAFQPLDKSRCPRRPDG
jgi:branched-chain amino acid transport system substrate-binding protein